MEEPDWLRWWRLIIRPFAIGVCVGLLFVKFLQHLAEDQQPWALLLFLALGLTFLMYTVIRTSRQLKDHQRTLEVHLVHLAQLIELERQRETGPDDCEDA